MILYSRAYRCYIQVVVDKTVICLEGCHTYMYSVAKNGVSAAVEVEAACKTTPTPDSPPPNGKKGGGRLGGL